MARVRDFAVTIETATASSTVLEMPEHEAGDLLLVWFNKDTAGGGPATPAGWSVPTAWGANPLNSAGSGNYLFARRATSSAETLTLAYTLETSITLVMAIRDVNGTTVDDAISAAARATADDLTLPLDGGAITPAHDNCLVVGLLGTDSGFGPYALPGWVNLFGGDAGANSLSACYTFQRAAAPLTHPGYWGATADDSRWGLLAIRDGSAGAVVPGYPDRGTEPARIVMNASAVTAADQGTWQAANSVQLLSLAGKTVSGVAIAAAADSGYNPFHAAARHIAPSSKTSLGASQITFTAAQDMTFGSGVLFGTFRPQLPRDYLDMGKATSGGIHVRLADAADNNKAWIVGGQLSRTTDPSNRQNFAIQVTQATDTAWASTGNLNEAAVNRLFVGGSGFYGACSVEWSRMFLLGETVLAGGSAAEPLNFDDVVQAVNAGSGDLPLMARNGSAATVWTRLKFGGGDPVQIGIALRTFQWPRAYDGDYLDFHVDSGVLGVEFHGQSGDSIAFRNCVFTSDSPYYWRFNAAHSAAASIDFAGTTVIGAQVTLRATSDLAGVSFVSCPAFTQNGAALAGCNFSATTVLASDPGAISDCEFTSGGTAPALELTAPGTYSFAGNSFAGYGANGTTDAAIYNNSGGAVTLYVSGGATPTVRNGAGASTTVNNAVTVTIAANVSLSGAEVRIYDLNNSPAGSLGTELAGTESNGGASFAFSGDAGNEVWVQIMLAGFEEYGAALTVPTVNSTITVPLRADLNA